MTSQQTTERFPMIIAVTCTLLMLVIGALVWHDVASELVAGIALVIAAIAISAVSPAAGLAAVMMALPTMHHIHPMPRGEFSLLELAIITSTAGIGINLLLVSFRSGWRHLGDVFIPAQVVVPVMMLIAATGVSLLNLADPPHTTEALREVRTVIIEPIMFLVAARMVLRRPIYRSWVGTVLMLTGAAIAFYGLAQLALDLGGVQSGDVTRATALYSHPNNLAVFLERTLLFTLGVAFIRPRWIPVWMLAGIQMLGLLATFSRGAIIGVIVGVALVLVFIGAWRWLLGLTAAGVVLSAIGLLIFPDRLLDVGGGGSEPTRFAIWRSSIEMIRAHPVFGVGPDQFLYQYNRRFIEPMGWPERYTSHPHNIILDTWLRLGVLGLASFATLIVGLVWWIQKKTSAIRRDAWAIGSIAALVGGMIHGMLDNGFFLPDLATMSWFFVVILVTVPGAVTTHEPHEHDIARPATLEYQTWPTWQEQR